MLGCQFVLVFQKGQYSVHATFVMFLLISLFWLISAHIPPYGIRRLYVCDYTLVAVSLVLCQEPEKCRVLPIVVLVVFTASCDGADTL